MQNKKHHYRAVFKSDHLGSADLEEMIEEGKSLIFTIKNVKQELKTKVAGKTIDANIAYFQENIKPMVLNATNSKQIAKFTGSKFVEDWNNVTIELYVQRGISFGRDTVDGVRIKPQQPKMKSRDFVKEISACKSVTELQKLWGQMNENEQSKLSKVVTAAKSKLEKQVA